VLIRSKPYKGDQMEAPQYQPTEQPLAPDQGPPPDWQSWPAYQKPAKPRRSRLKVAAGVAAVAGLLVVAAAANVFAADPTATPSASAAAPQASALPGTGASDGGPGDHGHRGGPTVEAVTDTSVAAQAIGISEADLVTALNDGQSMADVAKANNVDVQKVIDALVADKNAELDTAVKAGTMTQAQADAEKAEATQFVTDQVNGTFHSH
jgi:hypothetical protein